MPHVDLMYLCHSCMEMNANGLYMSCVSVTSLLNNASYDLRPQQLVSPK